MPAHNTLENPWYYLNNFEFVLKWIVQRYGDLLQSNEHGFIQSFLKAPMASRGLLARMIMRKGSFFRASKLQYREIGDTRSAAQALIENGWITENPELTVDELFGLLTKAELAVLFQAPLAATGAAAAAKAVQLEHLRAPFPYALNYTEWISRQPASSDTESAAAAVFAQRRKATAALLLNDAVYQENTGALSDRFRLMFFGNLRQDWSEFVLSDLGLFRYEKVEFPITSRAFHSRRDIDAYLHLHRCKERLAAGGGLTANTVELAEIRNDIAPRHDNDWLEGRRGKLLFQIGQQHERLGNWTDALSCYEDSAYSGARARRIRVLERARQFSDALELAQSALLSPESEAEHQLLRRMLPRLLRQTGGHPPPRRPPSDIPQIRLQLPTPATAWRVEEHVRDHLHQPQAPAFYVENTLINSLFGLLCWDAVFAAVPGAFFHPFQQGPADLPHTAFYARRRQQFNACLDQLACGQYRQTIMRNFTRKAGIQSPFVAWDIIDAKVLNMALACIPARHLQFAFERLLQDLPANRSGLPDLIQFWPAQQRYQMIEVKGPGDRLQDNQIRWLDYCHARHMPVSVCYVQYEAPAAP